MTRVNVTLDGYTYDIEVKTQPQSDTDLTAVVEGQSIEVRVPTLSAPEAIDWIIVDNAVHEIVIHPELEWLKSRYGLHHLEVRDLDAVTARPLSRDGRVKAPIPGLITRVMVDLGSPVKPGQPLLVLEAMKMENEICAPRAGTVSELYVSIGQAVTLNTVLAEIR